MDVEFDGVTFCGRYISGGSSLLNAINQQCNVTGSDIFMYKLVGVRRVVVEYLQVSRNRVNAYSIRIKL